MAVERPGDSERLGLLGRALPSNFAVRVHVIDPGRERPYDATEWRDALVEVDRGEVDLEFCSGQAVRFHAGDVLWLCGLGVRVICNRGQVPVVLVGVFRGQSVAGRAPSQTVRDEKRSDCRLNVHDDNRGSSEAGE